MTTRSTVRAAGVDWAVFAAAHATVVVHWRVFGDTAFGDLYLYHWWMQHGPTPVLEADWVYPVLGLAPMAAIGWIASAEAYIAGWIGLVTAINAGVFAVVRHRPGGRVAAWWWCAFIAALGPVALARLDAVTSALAILAIGWVVARPALASAVLTVAAWIKVAHAFWLPVLFTATPGRQRWPVVGAAVAVTIAVVTATSAAGGGSRVLSFGFEQSERGLQVESVLAAPFYVARIAGAEYAPSYNRDLGTNEFGQAGPTWVAGIADVVLVLGVAAFALAAAWAVRRAADAREPIVIAALLGVTAVLIVANKVGSPQLFVWFAAPVMAVIMARGTWFSQRTTWWLGGSVLGLGVITQLIYPHVYQAFLAGEVWIVVLYLFRTAIVVGVMGWAFATIVRLGSTQTEGKVDDHRSTRDRRYRDSGSQRGPGRADRRPRR